MNAEKSFSFPFEDKEWISKLGLGSLISLVPVLNFAWSGYLVGIIRNVMDQNPEPLPTWDQLDRKFMDGLILFGAGLLYALPILILVFLPLSITAFSGLISGNSTVQDLGQTLSETAGILFFCILCVGLLYGLVLSILYPVILVLYAREGTFASCFKLREAWGLISRNAAAFFTAWGLSLVVSLGGGFIIGFVNMVVGFVPCIGWIVGVALSLLGGVYMTAVYAHLFGQFGSVAFESSPLVPAD